MAGREAAAATTMAVVVGAIYRQNQLSQCGGMWSAVAITMVMGEV